MVKTGGPKWNLAQRPQLQKASGRCVRSSVPRWPPAQPGDSAEPPGVFLGGESKASHVTAGAAAPGRGGGRGRESLSSASKTFEMSRIRRRTWHQDVNEWVSKQDMARHTILRPFLEPRLILSRCPRTGIVCLRTGNPILGWRKDESLVKDGG